MGYQARRESRLPRARQVFGEAVALCRETNNQSLLASSLIGLGQIERDLKNHEAALQHYREAVDIGRRGAESLWLAHIIRHLADILREEGSLEEAIPLYEEVLAIYRKHDRTPLLDLANAIRGFALLQGARGEAEKARVLWQETRGLYESLGVKPGVDESDARIAQLK